MKKKHIRICFNEDTLNNVVPVKLNINYEEGARRKEKR